MSLWAKILKVAEARGQQQCLFAIFSSHDYTDENKKNKNLEFLLDFHLIVFFRCRTAAWA